MTAHHHNPRPAAGGLVMANPLRSWVILSIILLLLSVVPAVSATTIIDDISDNIVTSNDYAYSGSSTLTSYYSPMYITFNSVTEARANGNSALIFWPSNLIRVTDSGIYAAHTDCTFSEFKSTGIVYGTGEISYYIDSDGTNHYIAITFNDDCNFNANTQKLIQVNYNHTALNNIEVKGNSHISPRIGEPSFYLDTLSKGTLLGQYTFNAKKTFAHQIIVNGEPGEDTTIDIKRTLEGVDHHSTVSIKGEYKTNPYLTSTGATDITRILPGVDQGYIITIYSTLLDRTYEKTYFSTVSPEPTVGPGENPTATIYVQSSQTGALLANAQLSILAAAGDPPELIEVINATLPGGTGTYTLQPTGGGLPNPDYYRAVATVPGYTQIIENHSFTLNGPHDVIIEMRPDTGGPLDPDRAYLEFYVRDLNANPIPSASVQCDGRIKTTNSQGYAVFEVSKNATYPYVAKKSGYVTIEGTATVADGPRYVANVVLGPGTVPTYTPTLGPGETPGGPGATPTPDRRTNEQKGQSIIDMIADNAEPLAALALLGTFLGLFKLMAKW